MLCILMKNSCQKDQGRKKLTVKECVTLVGRFRGSAGAFLKSRFCSMNVNHLQIAKYAELFFDGGRGVKLLYIICTFEVGSLHTLRLESLKLVFQPLHKCLVNKL